MGRLLRHSIGFAILLLLTLAPNVAAACSCSQGEPAAIVRGVDVILDGYVESIEPPNGEGRLVATIRVLRAWKGDLPDTVTLQYQRYDMCGNFGALRPHTTLQLYGYGDPRQGPLWPGPGPCDGAYDTPSPELEALVHDYAARQQILRAAANVGSTRAKLRFAEFLLSYGDEPQARGLLLPILKNEPEIFRRWITEEGGHEALVWTRHKWHNKRTTPPTPPPSADGKMARAVFTLTGTPDPAWKDWSNLELIGGECRLENATLAGVSFAGSVLSACSFRHSKLSNADFSNGQLANARFEGATLSNVKFNGAYLNGANFKDASINDSEMQDVSGYNVSFSGGSWRNVVISGSLSGDLTKTAWQNVKVQDLNGQLDLSSATLRDVEFRDSGIRAVTKGAHLTNVRFIGGRLDGHVEDTDLRGVDYANITAMMIYVNCGTILPPIPVDPGNMIPVERNCPSLQSRRDFRSVKWIYQDLSGMDLSGSDFTDASLNGAKLLGTNLSKSNLTGVDFGNADLSGANLDGANLDRASNFGWFAGRTQGINGQHDAPPASLRGTMFGNTTIVITKLVGLAGHTASVDLAAPNFDNATLDCWDQPLEHYLKPALRTDAAAARQAAYEAEALQLIQAKWPTAKLTRSCSILQGPSTSATP
jgi:uncharacterized protein YjbI with pentapeptide repeats